MRNIMQKVHDALEKRWKDAGEPDGAVELCIWDMQRHLDGLSAHQSSKDVLAEAVGHLETCSNVDLVLKWCGKPGIAASVSEISLIAKAKEFLVVPA